MLGFSIELSDGTRRTGTEKLAIGGRRIAALSIADLELQEDRARLSSFAAYYYLVDGAELVIGGVRANGSIAERRMRADGGAPAYAVSREAKPVPDADLVLGGPMTDAKRFARSFYERGTGG